VGVELVALHPPDKNILVHTPVNFEELAKAGKSFNWNRPSCRNGCPKMWAHGYVSRYFEGFSGNIWLKRYRCRFCKAVVTLFPEGYYARFQSSISEIFTALSHRLQRGRWPPGLPRQRAGHWIAKFIVKAAMDFPRKDLFWVLRFLYDRGINLFS
jgi:hypothetical protein